MNIPLADLRQRLGELPGDRPIWAYCQVGQRAYYATRVLRLNGYDAHNLSGGLQTCAAMGIEREINGLAVLAGA